MERTKVIRRSNVYADFDAEKFKQRHAAARQRRADRSNGTQIINQIRESDDPIQTAHELLVPMSGKADTVAGEIVRAMMRILYRDYNDGDLFYDGYGIETCGDAVAFLCDKVPDTYSSFEIIALNNLTDSSYSDAINDIANEVLDYLYANPELFTQKNDEDMFEWDGEEFIESNEWKPNYEEEFYLPDNVVDHIEKGHISDKDVEWEVESWDYLDGCDISVEWGNTLLISGMSSDQYDEISRNMDDWLEDWGNQLDDEFGSEDDEEEYK